MRRRHRIPAAFLSHPPPSWRGRRRNPILRNSIITNSRHRTRRNPFHRNPGGGLSTTMLVVIGGGLFLFLSPQGRALTARLTGGAVPSTYPAGTVRLADGSYRLPSGQIVGAPASGGLTTQLMGQAVGLIPSLTTSIASWLRGLASGSSATGLITPGMDVGTVPGDVLGTGAETGTAPDILTSPGFWTYGEPLPPIPTLPDLTLSDWWSVDGAALAAPTFDLVGADTWADYSMDYSGFMGLGRRRGRGAPTGWSRTLRRPASYN